MLLEKQWFTLLTRSRFENIVTDMIKKKSIEVFLPTIRVRSRRKDRNLMINAPLFPGYLFVNISLDPREQLKVLKTTGAVRLLGSQQKPLPVPDTHIESLKIITRSGTDIITDSVTSVLKKGEPVLIINGPMAGATGEFMQYKGKGRVIIRIEALGQFAGVEIDEADLEKLPPIFS
ncbi:Transcriptional antiterminator (SH3-like protein) [Desulfamplus magnetovallimortis]|uniref:Transcriptional antiterminator (SH3-like protein) n=1 Tax=Desulfamplus magnetovallimortis TaxID=1246637 RepID=A0A1W1HLH2_9BACT|nr:UpxY family transcription antiterminator [Desulfamplus magnetovallimortis]SLM33275.1 Transcriptional antiterminator (SH3-like protein) [Desulfamplus magnetovallimortis]